MKRLFIIFSTILFVCILISCTETSHTVDFDSNGGTAVLSQTVLSGEFATKPQDPTYKDHTFIHWALEGVEFKFDEYPIVASITLTAVWAPDEGVNKHTVTFDSQGGSSVNAQEVVENGFATKPTNPTYAGHTFLHWALNDKEFNFETTPITAAITLLAVWEVNQEVITYTVTFDSKEGSNIPNQTVEANTLVIKPADPTKALYDFGGWYIGEVLYDFNTPVTSNITLEAKWTLTPEPTYVELSFAEGLLKMLGVEQKIIYNTKYEATLKQTQGEEEMLITAKIDLETNYETRNSHIMMLYNEELQEEIYVMHGKFYIEDFLEETKLKSPDIITDQFIGNFMGMASIVDTPNYYFKSFIENFNAIDILSNINTNNFKVYQKLNSYKVEVTLNEQTIPLQYKEMFMETGIIEAKLTLWIENNQIIGIDLNITVEDDIRMDISILQSDYDEAYIETIDPSTYETIYEQTYTLKVDYGVDGIVQEISYNEDFNSIYDMIFNDITSFRRDGYVLEGYYYDKAFTEPLDQTLMDKLALNPEITIYIQWVPINFMLDELLTFGDANNFMALETDENPRYLNGIYQLNEYIVFVDVFKNYTGYAVVYDMNESKYYLIDMVYGGYIAILYSDIPELTLFIEQFDSLTNEDFIRLGDLYIEQHKGILATSHMINLLNDSYEFYYNTYYMNTYDAAVFEARYDELKNIITNHLIDEDIVVESINLDTVHQYYDYELDATVYVFDKDHMIDDITIIIRDSAGMYKDIKLSDLNETEYTLDYTYNENLEPTLVELTYEGIEILYFAVIYDYDTNGRIYIRDNGIGYVSNFLTDFMMPSYLNIEEVNINGRYYEEASMDIAFVGNLLDQSDQAVNYLNIYYTLKDYTFFQDYLSTVDMVEITDDFGKTTIYYNLTEDILFNENFMISFTTNTITFKSEKFSLSVPAKDFNQVGFIESLPSSMLDEMNINIYNIFTIREIYKGLVIGRTHEFDDRVYTFGNSSYELRLSSDEYSFNFNWLNIKETKETIDLPDITTLGRTYEFRNNKDDHIIYITFDSLNMGYSDSFNYAPNYLYMLNVMLNDDSILVYYKDMPTTTTGYVINYENIYVVNINLMADYYYYDETLGDIVYIVDILNPLEAFKIMIRYNNGYDVTTDLVTLEGYTHELINVEGSKYTLTVVYEDITIEVYVDTHDYVLDGQVFIINGNKYSYSDLDTLETLNISTLYSIWDVVAHRELNTLEDLKDYILETNESIYILEFVYRIISEDDLLQELQTNIINLKAYDTNYYMDLTNQIIIGDNFTFKLEGEYVIYENKDVIYKFLTTNFDRAALYDVIEFDDMYIIEISYMLKELLQGRYQNAYRGNNHITFYFEQALLEIEDYGSFMILRTESPYFYTDFEFVDVLPEKTFTVKANTYTIYNNIDSSHYIIKANNLDNILGVYGDFMLDGLFTDSSFETEVTGEEIGNINLYAYYIENVVTNLEFYVDPYISLDGIEEDIVFMITYLNGDTYTHRLSDLDPLTYTLEVYTNTNLNETYFTLTHKGFTKTLYIPIYDASLGVMAIDQTDYYHDRYFYLNDYNTYIPAYLTVTKIKMWGYVEYNSFEELMIFAEANHYNVIYLSLEYEISDISLFIDTLPQTYVMFETYAEDAIYYDFTTQTIYSNNFTFTFNEVFVEYKSAEFSFHVPSERINQMGLENYLDYESYKIIADIMMYESMIFNEFGLDVVKNNGYYLTFELSEGDYKVYIESDYRLYTSPGGYYKVFPVDEIPTIEIETTGYTYTVTNNLNSLTYTIQSTHPNINLYSYPNYYIKTMTINGATVEALPEGDAAIYVEYALIDPVNVWVFINLTLYDEINILDYLYIQYLYIHEVSGYDETKSFYINDLGIENFVVTTEIITSEFGRGVSVTISDIENTWTAENTFIFNERYY